MHQSSQAHLPACLDSGLCLMHIVSGKENLARCVHAQRQRNVVVAGCFHLQGMYTMFEEECVKGENTFQPAYELTVSESANLPQQAATIHSHSNSHRQLVKGLLQ